MTQTCPHCGGKGRVITSPCATCKGRGRYEVKRTVSVKIPPGVETGSMIKMAGEGNAGEDGGMSGSLYVYIRVREHEIFQRQGNHVVCEMPISFPLAALGGVTEVPTLEGSAKVKISPGTQTGQVYRLKGQGIPDMHGYGRGDELVRIFVETPSKLNEEQKELLGRFAEIGGDKIHPLQKTFVDKVKKILWK